MPEKACGLIAVIPSALHAEWAASLPVFLKRFRPAALLLNPPYEEAAAALIAAAGPHELGILFRGAVADAKQAGASGVYLAGGAATAKAARETLGSAAIIGAACALSRHQAMEAAEAGADFVSFEALAADELEHAATLSAWWDKVTGVPSAIACDASFIDASFFEKALPDFLLVEETRHAGQSLTFATEFGLQSET
jgi:thiamine-phosphate pyrophosphorylase